VEEVLERGTPTLQVSRAIGVSTTTIDKWVKLYEAGGVEGLTPKPRYPLSRARQAKANGKDIVQALAGGGDLPAGAPEALRDLVGSDAPDAVQVGRALHWAASQPPMHGVRLNCRKNRDKFSWCQVVRTA
jgi:transposase-like protein